MSEDTNDVAKAVEFLNCNGKEIVCGLHTIHGRDKNDSTIVDIKDMRFRVLLSSNKTAGLQGTKIQSTLAILQNPYIGIPLKTRNKLKLLIYYWLLINVSKLKTKSLRI